MKNADAAVVFSVWLLSVSAAMTLFVTTRWAVQDRQGRTWFGLLARAAAVGANAVVIWFEARCLFGGAFAEMAVLAGGALGFCAGSSNTMAAWKPWLERAWRGAVLLLLMGGLMGGMAYVFTGGGAFVRDELVEASRRGDAARVHVWVALGANPSRVGWEEHVTPLGAAAQAERADMVRLLLRLGANVNERDDHRQTPSPSLAGPDVKKLPRCCAGPAVTSKASCSPPPQGDCI